MKQKRSFFLILASLILLAAIWSALALVRPQPHTLDERVHSVASQLKCPVCQGESVADSSADLAIQMRQVIRQQLQSGRSEQDVVQYFANRYGSDIVLTPPWQGLSLLAWLVPILLFLSGCVFLAFVFREWSSHAPVLASSGNIGGEELLSEDKDLAYYREQLERELAADDLLFKRNTTEAR